MEAISSSVIREDIECSVEITGQITSFEKNLVTYHWQLCTPAVPINSISADITDVRFATCGLCSDIALKLVHKT